MAATGNIRTGTIGRYSQIQESESINVQLEEKYTLIDEVECMMNESRC